MTAWDHLPLPTRRAVTTHVERSIATFRTQEPEDVARFAVEALLRDRSFEHQRSYMEGYEAGVQGQEPRSGAA